MSVSQKRNLKVEQKVTQQTNYFVLKKAEVTNDQQQRTHWQQSSDNLAALQKMVTFSEYIEQ